MQFAGPEIDSAGVVAENAPVRARTGLLLLWCFLGTSCARGPVSPPWTEPTRPGPEERELEAARERLDHGDLNRAGILAGDLEARLVLEGFPPRKAGLLSGVRDLRLRIDLLQRVSRAEGLPDLTPVWWTEADLQRPEVEAWKKRYLADGGRGLRRWTRQIAPYFREIHEAITESGLPPELWVLTLVESGFQTRARSHANAVGPWQFVRGTARHCGLLVTTDRDERMDWMASTRGACLYLQELKDSLGDGLLALAAFNCGPARLRRALAEDPAADFHDLDLPPETRDYVPKSLALVALLGAGNRSPFEIDPHQTLDYEEIDLPYTVEISHLARACGVSKREMLRLNPSWSIAVTPADGKPVKARIPLGKRARVVEQLEAKQIPEIKISPNRMYTIRRGDTLWDISRKFRVSLDILLKVNGMNGKEVIRPGREIRLPG